MPVSVSIAQQRRNLAGWLVGFSSSYVADAGVLTLALTWAAVEIGSPAGVGAVVASGAVARLALLLFGGVLADRGNPKIVLMVIDGVRALITAAAMILIATGMATLPMLVAYAVAVNGLGALFQPAIDSLPPRIVRDELKGRLGAIQTLVLRLSLLVGAPLAGILISWRGTSAAFAACAILFAITPAAFLIVRIPRRDRSTQDTSAQGVGAVLADVRHGARILRTQRTVAWVLLLAGVVNLGFAGPMTAGIPLLAEHEQWGAGAAGWIFAAFALGSGGIATGFLVAARPPRAGIALVVAGMIEGLCLATIGADGLPATLVAALLLGMATGVFGICVRSLLFSYSPEAGLGRVMSMFSFAQTGVQPISMGLTGVVVAAHSPTLMFIGGGIMIAGVAIVGATRPALRQARIKATSHD